MVLYRANDLLDQRFLENGKFSSQYGSDSASKAMLEIVKIIRVLIQERNLAIKCNFEELEHAYPSLSFDKRRLQ